VRTRADRSARVALGLTPLARWHTDEQKSNFRGKSFAQIGGNRHESSKNVAFGSGNRHESSISAQASGLREDRPAWAGWAVDGIWPENL